MQTTRSVIIIAMCAAGCTSPSPDGTSGQELTTVGTSAAPWTIFADPYGDGTPNAAQDIWPGQLTELRFLHARTTKATLSVSGLPAMAMFMAHAHKLACSDAKGGGHYQDQPAPAGEDPKDPRWANPQNEMWFQLMTDETGRAEASAYVKWLVRDHEALSLVIHDIDDDGTGNPIVGPRLACLDFAF
jgi:superoxide dismutase, Cu-Zn family